MPPKKKSPPKKKASAPPSPPPPVPPTVTLEQAIKSIDNLPNASGSKDIWRNNIISLAVYSLPADKRGTDYFNLKYAELAEKYKDINILPLIEDYERTMDIIEIDIVNKTNGEALAFETRKQYMYMLLMLIGKNGVVKLDGETTKKYTTKKEEYDILSKENRATNVPKAGVGKYPEMTWEMFKMLFNQYLTETAFTNTVKGKKDIRQAVVAGLYLLQIPRRVEDYATLQLYSTLPSEKEREGKNILLLGKDKATIYIDKFKTRWITSKNGTKKEVLPTFVKELPSKLTSLFKDYIVKYSVTDMSKLKKTDKNQHFVFYKENGKTTDGYDSHSFSKLVATTLKAIFKKGGLSVNTIRHVFQDFIIKHMTEYNDLQLKTIAHEFGDRNPLTMLGYRQTNQDNRDMNPEQINQLNEDRNIAQIEALAGGLYEDQASEGSIGTGEDPQVQSPIRQEPNIDDTPLNVLYLKLGQAHMEVKRLEMEIMRRLN